MGVLWSFMGASVPYIIFSGACEVAGGLLVLFRRTTTFGALVNITVMANVVALNFFYGVPVKLYSANILLMAVVVPAHHRARRSRKRVVSLRIFRRSGALKLGGKRSAQTPARHVRFGHVP